MDLERFKILGKLRGAFSVAEMLVVMLVLSIVIISMTPVMVKRVKKEAANPDHGTFECFWDKKDGRDVLIERIRNARGEIVSTKERTNDEYCSFTPKRGAMFFTVNAVGGGSPGAGMMSDLPEDWQDYTIEFNQFKGIDALTTTNNKVDIIGQTFDNLPDIIKNNLSIPLKVILASSGGKLDENTGASFLVREDSGTHTHDANFDKDNSNIYLDNKSNLINGPLDSDRRFNVYLYRANLPKPGKRLIMSVEAKDGLQLSMDKNEVGGLNSPEFSIGASKCKITKGGDGKYHSTGNGESCSSSIKDIPNAKIENTATCNFPSVEGYKSRYTTDDIRSNNYELNVDSSNLRHGYTNDDCNACRQKLVNIGNGTKRYVACSPNYRIGETSMKEYPITVWGRFATVLKTRSKGVNFYGPAGNPGEFKTIYVSRFTNNVRITPGRPQPVPELNDTNPQYTGNDTTICYPDSAGTNCGTILLTALGGKAPRLNNSGSKDFIVGSMFNLSETGQVIAYNHPDNNLKDPSESNYGHYFKTKESGFVYPVPDSENTIPSTAGQGGHGAYTIFRKAGKSNAFELWKTNFSDKNNPVVRDGRFYYDYFQRVGVGGSYGDLSNTEYECENGEKIFGNNAEAHFCKPGGGHGGAVVITW